jgi:hypothetical protein
MNDLERANLAKAWIAHQKTKRGSTEYPSLFWTFEQVCDLVQDDPEEAWKVILSIWFLDQSQATMQNLSAGPIEDLLSQHGEKMISHLEIEAKRGSIICEFAGRSVAKSNV